MKKTKMSARMVVLGGAVVVLAFAGVYAYNNFVVGLGKSDASEIRSEELSCRKTGQSINGNVGTIVFTATTDIVPPTKTSPTIFSWTVRPGVPSSGTGQTFKTSFTRGSSSNPFPLFTATVTHGGQSATCTGTIIFGTPTPSPSSSPIPSITPLAIPYIRKSSLPIVGMTNGTNTLLKFSVAQDITLPPIGWRRMYFNINKTLPVALTNFHIFQNGVDLTGYGSFVMNGVGSGQPSAYVIFSMSTPNPINTVPGGSTTTFELRADVSGALPTEQYVQTLLLNPNGTGPYISGTYDQLAQGNATFIWTDHVATPNSPYWFTDRNVQYLPIEQTIISQ